MKKHIIFTGGGTGGHVYPALAIIETLLEDGHKISWIGSKKGIEYKIIKNENIDFYSIPSGKLRRYFSFLNFLDLFKIIMGFIYSFFILIRIKPDLIFSKGGYVTVPPIIISKLLNIKSITHESDYSPGLATKINSRFVNKILVPYTETKKYFNEIIQKKVVVTGNPVRKSFYYPNEEIGKKIMNFSNDKPIILVLGGSLGAKQINDLIFQSKEILCNNYNIYHQMGESNFLEANLESYKTVPFIKENMQDIIKAADLVISRSGAGAIWEFVTVGTPSLLIPLIAGSRGDQVLNANYFESLGVSLVINQENISSSQFVDKINDYFIKSITKMKSKSVELNLENSVIIIKNIIKEML